MLTPLPATCLPRLLPLALCLLLLLKLPFFLPLLLLLLLFFSLPVFGLLLEVLEEVAMHLSERMSGKEQEVVGLI
jgi:hypothetical protein